MRRKLVLVIAAIILLFSTGCSAIIPRETIEKAKEETAYEKIQNMLINLESYKSEATVEYISNKGRNTYETLQQSKITGQYRVEVLAPDGVAGNVTLSDGSTIYQFNPRISAKVSMGVKENQERSEIFITSFIRNYLQSDEVSVSVGNFGDGKCTVLEASIPGNHPYLSTEKMWIDNKTLQPVKLVVFDPDGGERIVVTYNTFEHNIELDENLFKYNS